MRHSSIDGLRIAAVAALAVLLQGGALLAEDGRDYAGVYELTEVTDLGEQVTGRFAARVFNYSGADRIGATVVLEGWLPAGESYASFPYQTILYRRNVRVSAWVTISKAEYEQWLRGAAPTLWVEFKDESGNACRSPVELSQGLVGEEN